MLDARRFSYLWPLVICGALISQPARADSTERVSVDSAGQEGNNTSTYMAISADGRFVAFESSASNLVTGDANGAPDIFVHDRQTGVTERVSVDSAGDEADSGSQQPAISADGRFVAFYSVATNLVTDDTNGHYDVFVHDRQTGATERVSLTHTDAESAGASINCTISADGRFVAFLSGSTDIVPGDTNGQSDIFVRDRLAGTTERVNVTSAGAQAVGGPSAGPAISADGRFVAFHSQATNLVTDDTNGTYDVFVHDRQTGMTERVSVDSAEGEATGPSAFASISADGRFVAFYSEAADLVPGDTNVQPDIFVHDRLAGTTERVSVDSSGAEGNGSSNRPSISADGRFVAFDSQATNLVADDTNIAFDAFVHDRLSGTTERVSVDSAGMQGDDNSQIPVIAANDRFVAFYSGAMNLVAGDGNGFGDVFVRDRGLLPDGRNDFLADFGPAGLWQRLNDTTWQKLHNASPQMVASGDLDGSLKDEALASFGGLGLWARYDNMTWVKLHNATPVRFVVGDFDGNGSDDLVVDFGGAGIWVKSNNGTWSKLHNGTTQDLAVGDLDGNGEDELIADFGGAGLWVRYNGSTWAKRHNASPVHIATGDLDGNGRDELIVDFGALGLWVRLNDATWMKLHNATSQGFVTGDLDGNDQEELIVDFGSLGLWVRYNNATWVKRHNASPERMLATDLDGNGMSDLVADFGAAGLWVKHNNGAWTKIHNATTQDLAAGGFD